MSTGQMILHTLELIFLETTGLPSIVWMAAFIAGLWMTLKKSGIPGWWALVPCARYWQLARAAGREPEGRMLSVLAFIETLVGLGEMLYDWFTAGSGVFSETADMILLITVIAISLIRWIFMLRTLPGLLEIYGMRRAWLWLGLIAETRWILLVIIGFSRKRQPAWKPEDLKAAMEKIASTGSATVMKEGLTVNLNQRTATEFFQKKVLLRDIHMSIPQGHMVLLLGGSGAGKTTFVNAINGYEKADAEVMLNSSNIYKQYKQLQYDIGFVPQQEMMRGKDTVLRTLQDAAKLRLPRDLSKEMRNRRVDEVMEIFGLVPVKNNLVEKLSGGQKKRLSISIEFLSNPSLFILDEPDSGLDGVMARELFEQLRKIADTGKIVMVITHTPDRVIDLFDDVIVLAKDQARTGRLAFYGSIGEARAFFGREKMEEIVRAVNRKEEGGDGLADEFVQKYAEVRYA